VAASGERATIKVGAEVLAFGVRHRREVVSLMGV